MFRKPLLPLFEFLMSTLVLIQLQNPCEIRISQSLLLVFQADPPLTQLLPSSLQFLWKPKPTLSSLQRLGNVFRMSQHLTHILPNQFIELISRNEARGALFVSTGNDRMSFSTARVVGMAWMAGAASTSKMASSTTDEGS